MQWLPQQAARMPHGMATGVGGLIVLGDGEELRRRYPAKMKNVGKGTLYLTSSRVCFENSKDEFCFGVSYENVFNWGRDKKNLYLTWYEPQPGRGWKYSDRRRETSFEIGRKKFNGSELTTFEAAMSLYYSFAAHFRYGYKGVGIYAEQNEKIYCHYMDSYLLKWDEVKAGKFPVTDVSWRGSGKSVFERDYISLTLNDDEMRREFEEFSYELAVPADDFKDRVTGKPFGRRGQHDTLLFLDMVYEYGLFFGWSKDKLLDIHGIMKSCDIMTQKRSRELVATYEKQMGMIEKGVAREAQKIASGEIDPNERLTMKIPPSVTVFGIVFGADMEATQTERIEWARRGIRYNRRCLELVSEQVKRNAFNTQSDYFGYLRSLQQGLHDRFVSKDDADIDRWTPKIMAKSWAQMQYLLVEKFRQRLLTEVA